MPHIVSGVLKDYPWGVIDGLARWHGATGGPQAELWFGAHPAGPSPIVEGPDAGRTLDEWETHRGVPLVKLLAAGSPLSIQVHPDLDYARAGWSAGSPLLADDAEKSEVLVALEPFEIHAGWRAADDAADLLASAGAPDDVIAAARQGRPRDAARLLLALDPHVSRLLASRLVDAVGQSTWPTDAAAALTRVITVYPDDPGALVTVLLDHAILSPGDAVAVPAGVVHSYVGGLAVEVMTSSDNVLRLGLTGKTIAIEEALAAVRLDRSPERIRVRDAEPIAPEGMPFDVVITDSAHALATGRHRTVVALEGGALISTGASAPVRLPEGRAAIWSPGEPDALVRPGGRVVVVTGA